MSEMISFGAGVNSVAMTIMLVNEGWRGPIVLADTGGEHPETYCYLEYFEKDFLSKHSLNLVRLAPGSEYHNKRYNVSLEQFCLNYRMIPLIAARWCSIEYKRNPCENWKKDNSADTVLIGFAIDEARRASTDKDNNSRGYPLIEQYITREGCRKIIAQSGLAIPPKSGCFFCPMQPLGAWRTLYYEYPDLYERASQLEIVASERVGKTITLNGHGQTLKDYVRRRWQGQLQMDLSEWLPCICKL